VFDPLLFTFSMLPIELARLGLLGTAAAAGRWGRRTMEDGES
jgi:hypothetical protein